MNIEVRIIHQIEICVEKLWESDMTLKDYVMEQLGDDVDSIDDITVEEL